MLSIYKASAGSGKTFTLAREYIRLLFMQAGQTHQHPHKHILAVTFTKKATAEMKERIMRELYILATTPDRSPHYQYLLSDFALNEQQLRQRAKDLLFDILQDYTDFAVNTIDGFFQHILRAFAREMGLPAQYELTLDSEQVIQQAVDDLLFRLNNHQLAQDTARWLTQLVGENVEQNRRWNPREQMYNIALHLLTESLQAQLHQARNLLEDKQFLQTYREAMQEICDNHLAALNDILNRAQALLRPVPHDTFNANAIRPFSLSAETLMDKPIHDRGLSETFLKCARGEAPCWKKTAKHVDKARQAWDNGLALCFTQLADYVEGEQARNYHTATIILDNLYLLGLLSDITEQIQRTNIEQNRLPISEVNDYLNRIIDHADAPFIYEKMGERIRHYMMDEFQDTSVMQWDNFRPLIADSNSRGYDNLIVGDIKQSIYRWRNGDWHILADIDKHMPAEEPSQMRDNWRSSHVIVHFNNSLFGRYADYAAAQLNDTFGDGAGLPVLQAYSNYQQQARKQDLSGYVQATFFDEQSAGQALNRLPELLDNIRQRGGTLGDTAVLVRTRDEAQQVCNTLLAAGFEVQSAEGMRIHTHPAVQLIDDLLQLTLTPDNDIVRTHLRLIWNDNADAADTTDPVEQTRHTATLPLYEQVQAIIDILRLDLWDRAAAYLTAYQDLIYTYTTSRTPDTAAWLDWWTKRRNKVGIPAPKTPTAVQVLTIHASKGLEFQTVIIPFLSWSLAAGFRDHGAIHWYRPARPPFVALPVVPVPFGKRMAHSHFQEQYQREVLDLYMDNLNLTYVAFTRPVRELYLFGPTCPDDKQPANIGQLLHTLLGDDYAEGQPVAFAPLQTTDEAPVRQQTYVSTPVGNRLRLRTRSLDQDGELSPLQTGTLMHEWLARLDTLDQADAQLQKLIDEGLVAPGQVPELRHNMELFSDLVQGRHWFDTDLTILRETDILTTSGNTFRPDRVVLQQTPQGTKAIVIDYKFGTEQRPAHREQVRNYMTLLNRMGYITEGWLVYVTLRQILPV